jgi:hypothetical protein
MTTLKTNAIEPEGATTNLAVGMTGQNVVIGGSGGIKANTFKDAGGNTLWTSNGSGVLSSVSGFGGAQVLISSQTASNSASIIFTLPTAYKQVVFEFYNIVPSTSPGDHLLFDCSVLGSYGTTKTTTFFRAYHTESDSTALQYVTGLDQAQTTNNQQLMPDIGSGGDESGAGTLTLFNPAGTTYAKHFYGRFSYYYSADYAMDVYPAGYFNTTSALDGIKFVSGSGNIASGTIKMYGIK